MEIEEFRALKEGTEQGTPQAPQRAVEPETPPVENQDPPPIPGVAEIPQVPEGGQEPVQEPIQQVPQGIPPENEAAMYRRKYQESEGKNGLLQQQLQFQQQQIQTVLQQQAPPQVTQPQDSEMPEFEDPQLALEWIRKDNARQRKADIDALRSEFKETTLKTEREKAAGRIFGLYPQMNDNTSLLHQQFTSECYTRGINPQTADPYILEATAAIAAQKCGILPENVQQNTAPNAPLPTTRPPIPSIQRIAPPAPQQPTYTLSARQASWADTLNLDPDKVTAFMKNNATKYVRADGTPLYGRRK